MDLSALDGSDGFVLYGVDEEDRSGLSVSSAGDVNGDGFDDLLIGATLGDDSGNLTENAGDSYVVFGKAGGWSASVDLSALNGSDGFVLYGAEGFDWSGRAVSSAGDVNGDGFDDLLIGAYRADGSGNGVTDAGETYVIFGKSSGWNASVNLGDLDGSDGFVLYGVDGDDQSGRAVSSAGDVNGDGFDDLLIGARQGDGSGNGDGDTGEAYVLFGKAGGWSASLSLSDLDGSDGFALYGVDAGDRSGQSVSSAGDVNGDGFDDLLIGSHEGDGSGNGIADVGESHVFFGRDFTNQIDGSGSVGADYLVGSALDDTIAGLGGVDVISGGAGDDLLAVSDLSFSRIDGGNGEDTLRLDGSNLDLDLASISDTRLQDLEVIDLNGNSNMLTLTKLEVLNLSTHSNTLRVMGGADNGVSAESGWVAAGTQVVDAVTYDVFTQYEATLLVQQGVNTFLPSGFELAALDGNDGFVIYGVDGDDQSGFLVSNAGDVNGDGFDDLLIGSRFTGGAGNGGAFVGENYVVFGKAGAWSSSVELSDLNGSDGFVLYGIDNVDVSGLSASSAGDVNGDGFDDLVIGASGGNGDTNGVGNLGESYVVFGKASAWGASLDLSALNGSDGFVMYGVDAADESGISVSSAGDVNGDGFDDILIGARFADGAGNGEADAGEAYVVFGKAGGWSASMDLSALDGSDGFLLYGVDAGDQSGYSVSSAGDVNGDGFDDLLIGAFKADGVGNGSADAGEAYVVFGKAGGWSASVDLSGLDGSDGFVIYGEADVEDWLGRSVSSGGDVNGDGFADLLIGVQRGDGAGNGDFAVGETYVVFGKAGGWSASVDLSDLDGSDGFVLYGIDEIDSSGRSVSSAGDVNGDGFDDILIGAYFGDGSDNGSATAGESYVVFGKAGGWGASMDLSDLDGSDGFVLYGVDAGDRSGRSVSSAGDVNGDGFDDLLIGSPEGSGSGNGVADVGESHVFFGRDFTNQIDASGSAGADYLVGSALDDTLAGLGGADVISGGAGDDVLVVSDLSFSRIDGGNGEDTLRLDADNLDFDLTAIPDSRLQDVEVIDLNGSDNTLTLTQLEVLNLSTHSNTLRVMNAGVNGNTVDIGSGWTDEGIQVIDSVEYEVFTQGEATILLEWATKASFELADLDGSDGFVLNGEIGGEFSAWSVSDAGDVNGDGFDDLLIGAPQAGPNGNTHAGQSYVVFGKASGWSASQNLSALDGSDGFVINGININEYSGRSVSSAGDVNGDGFDDLLVGVWNADANGNNTSGQSFLVFGKGGVWGASMDLSSLDGSSGLVFNGIDIGDHSGRSVSSAGDVNGDGLDDLLIGAPQADPDVGSDAGESYVVFGEAGVWNSSFELSNLDGANGFVVKGAAPIDMSGWAVSSAGDVNGDGFDDLLIGAIAVDVGGKNATGAAYVVFGKANGWSENLDLNSLDGSDGFVLNGASSADQSGFSVSSTGDVNGDGYDDLIVGAADAPAYVVFGKESGWTAGFDLSTLSTGDGSDGFRIKGVDESDKTSRSVSTAGDINGDGFDDLLVGAWRADPNGDQSGASYVVFGKASGWSGNLELSSLDGITGFALNGIDAWDYSGYSVSSAGDVNGDGFDDLLIGAYGADANGYSNSGETYVFFGRDFTDQIDLSGSAGADYLVGSALDDTLVGLGGADAITGGGGDDVLVVGDLAFARIDGGNGEDTLRLDGNNLDLDLSTMPDTRLQDLEAIDLNGNSNTLTLSKLEVLNFSTHSNTLRVMGGSGNGVSADFGWTAAGTQVVDTITYDVYTQDEATLLVQQGGMTFFQALAVNDVFELSALDGSDGFVLNGVEGDDRSGISVSNAGDVNGDGFDDLLVGAYFGDPNGSLSGESYMVFGKASGWSGSFELSTLAAGDGSTGFVLNGVDLGDRSGISVSSAGDVNGDGFDDLLVGADRGDPNGSYSGESYVVFGKASGWSGSFELSTLAAGDGSTGFVLNGVGAGDWSGKSVSSAGDVNGDGFDDLLMGADRVDRNGSYSGESYLVFGKASGWSGSFELSTLAAGDGSTGFVLNGVGAGDWSGLSVSSAGDVNGDGFDDLLVGAKGGDPNGNDSGESYVVFGKVSGWSGSFELSTLAAGDGSTGFVLNGVGAYDVSGRSVSSAGDVNGDGFDDLLVGADGSDPNGSWSGESYVVFGKASGWSGSFELSTLVAGDGSAGFVLNGVDGDDLSGLSVSNAGDVNGDGFDDLLVGALRGDPNGNDSGESYVVFGKASGWSGSFELSMLAAGDGSTGFVLNGAGVGDRSGRSVSSAGDVNGDGFDDVLVGARFGDPNGNDSGESYVFFGRDFTQQIDGSGTAGADYLVGSALDDTLAGLGGADAIRGGAGDDVLAVSDLSFNRIDGGNGEDTLRLDGSSLDLDLTTVPDSRLQDLEVIDLNGNSNTLTLTKLEVLNLSSHSNTLRVMGGGVNSVTFSGFSAAGTTVIDTVTYDVYTSGEATLQLQQGLTLNISPVVIDLNGDGVIDYQALDAGVAFDADGDGNTESVAWVGPNDGFLVFDANGDQLVTDRSELALSDHAEGARTDLEGLAMAFDTDGNGRFDANDDDWSRFGIWQDKNQDGVTDDGEFFTMEEAGIESIDLAVMDAVAGGNVALTQSHPVDGVTVFGETTVQFSDGSEGLAADVGLGFQHGEDSVIDLDGVLAEPTNPGGEEDQALVAAVDELESDDDSEAGIKSSAPSDEIVIPGGVMQENPVLDATEEELMMA